MAVIQDVQAKVLDHLGLVSAIIDKIGLEKKINSLISKKSKPYSLTHGQVVKALILAGLGLQERPLYLMKEFFRGRPVESLIGKGITAEMFSDMTCGRTLDAIYEYGIEKFFYSLISLIDRDYDLFNGIMRCDTSSIPFQGKYKTGQTGKVKLARGHSKEKRPDLLQLILSMGMSGDNSLPLMMGVHSGNESDKNILPRMVLKTEKLRRALSWNDKITFIVDSAIYSEKFVMSNPFNNSWITRIPESNKTSKKILEEDYEDICWERHGELQYATQVVNLYGVPQRWIMCYSAKSYYREMGTLKNRLDKAEKAIIKKINQVNQRIYERKEEASQEFNKLKKQYPLYNFTKYIKKKFSRNRRSKRKFEGHKIYISYSLNEEKYRKLKNKKGRFIIGTNEAYNPDLSDRKIINLYKQQDKIEKGFKFLKDKSFSLNKIFLKKKQRIHALLLIIVLTLFVYNFGQNVIREKLKTKKKSYYDQKHNLTKKPTLKWIFQSMRHIVEVKIKIKNQVHTYICNISHFHKVIFRQLGVKALEIYGFS